MMPILSRIPLPFLPPLYLAFPAASVRNNLPNIKLSKLAVFFTGKKLLLCRWGCIPHVPFGALLVVDLCDARPHAASMRAIRPKTSSLLDLVSVMSAIAATGL